MAEATTILAVALALMVFLAFWGWMGYISAKEESKQWQERWNRAMLKVEQLRTQAVLVANAHRDYFSIPNKPPKGVSPVVNMNKRKACRTQLARLVEGLTSL